MKTDPMTGVCREFGVHTRDCRKKGCSRSEGILSADSICAPQKSKTWLNKGGKPILGKRRSSAETCELTLGKHACSNLAPDVAVSRNTTPQSAHPCIARNSSSSTSCSAKHTDTAHAQKHSIPAKPKLARSQLKKFLGQFQAEDVQKLYSVIL